MSKKHKVVSHVWNNGILRSLTNFFNSFDEAENFSDNLTTHAVKIYDEDEQIVHASGASIEDTYA